MAHYLSFEIDRDLVNTGWLERGAEPNNPACLKNNRICPQNTAKTVLSKTAGEFFNNLSTKYVEFNSKYLQTLGGKVISSVQGELYIYNTAVLPRL